MVLQSLHFSFRIHAKADMVRVSLISSICHILRRINDDERWRTCFRISVKFSLLRSVHMDGIFTNGPIKGILRGQVIIYLLLLIPLALCGPLVREKPQ